jgi:hypothetical protein
MVALPYEANGGYGDIDDPYPPFAPKETRFGDRNVQWERGHRLLDTSVIVEAWLFGADQAAEDAFWGLA